MGRETSSYLSNYGIPNANGPRAMVAGIWDDLDPGNSGQPSDIYYYYDAPTERFIVQYFRVEHWSSGSHEDFEIILYDPVTYPTPTGDGEIIVQYLIEMQQADNTLGIENYAETVGIQYYLDGTYNPLAEPVIDSFAIKYTTWPPSTPAVEEQFGSRSLTPQTHLALSPTIARDRLSISFTVANPKADVALKIYDISGRLVRSFDDLVIQPINQVVWNGCDDVGRRVAAGVYFIRLETEDHKQVEKAVLLK